MRIRLSNYDPDDPPFQPGDRVRIRPVADWADPPFDKLTRPIECQFQEGQERSTISWPVELDRCVGQVFELESGTNPDDPPVILADGLYHHVHPDWLEKVESKCTCPILMLMHRGCQCGQMDRERGGSAATRNGRC